MVVSLNVTAHQFLVVRNVKTYIPLSQCLVHYIHVTMEGYARFCQITHNSVSVHHTLKDLSAAKRKILVLSMNAKTMESVSLPITMITCVVVQMASKVKNVNNLTSVTIVKPIHAKTEESVYVPKVTDTGADVPMALKATNVRLKHNHIQCHNAPPVQTTLTAQPMQHQNILATNVKKGFHACLNHVKMEVLALILTMVLTAPVLLASLGKPATNLWLLLSV